MMNKTIVTLLAGVVIGIILAPDKGSETLKKLRSRVRELKDQAADKVSDLASEGKAAVQRGQSEFSDILE